MATFDRAELDEMITRWVDANKRAEAEGDWKPLADMYTEDATYGWNYGPKDEFMAVGRPLVLPAANVGLRLRDGVDALLLRRGTPDEIAARVAAILDDPALAARLAGNAQAFARRTWRWDVQGRKLARFLERWRRAAA